MTIRPSTQSEYALLAGGCFWGMQDLIRKLPGVISTEVGYTGGTSQSPRYAAVKTGSTGHAESIRIEFDPSQISYDDLLRFFFKIHDPTTVDRQGNDRGSQYRSAIFYHSPAQKGSALKIKTEAQNSGLWTLPIVTQIVPAGEFYSAEAEHQDYLERNPGGYTCHYIRK